MQLAPGLINQRDQPALDCEVDIFVGNIELEAPVRNFAFDTLESADDRPQLARLEQSDLRKHLRMRNRSANIVQKKPPVEWQRRRECFDLGKAAARKSSTDETFLAA